MPLTSFESKMSIAVGVLLAVAIAYSFVQTWAWSRRAGKTAIDFVSLVKFVAFSCGNMSNAFFVTTFGSSIWWLIFYKVLTWLFTKNSLSPLAPVFSVVRVAKIRFIIRHLI
jgi:Meckelin (Transmembrane protein 67)